MSGRWAQVVPELTGRELDAAVAERVMGWKPLGQSATGNRFYADDNDDRFTVGDSNLVRCWSPSRDVAATMDVWDKLVADGYLPRLLTMVDGYVVNVHARDSYHVVQVAADTKEVAICRAALATVDRAQATASSEASATTQ